MTADPVLELQGVSLSYGAVRAVDDVSLEIPHGEIHCLLGTSGSGKSSLLRIVAGLERQGEGTVSIAGELVSGPGSHTPTELLSLIHI